MNQLVMIKEPRPLAGLGGFDNCFGHFFSGVDFENPLDLGEKPVQQAQVSARDPDDGCRCVRVQRMSGKLHAGRPIFLLHFR
jgi:hypothetical protein